MKRGKLWAIIGVIILIILLIYVAASWLLADFMIAAPAPSLEDERAANGVPADFGLPDPEDITIQSGDITLSGWYFDNPRNGNCGVMFMHGFIGSRYQALYWAPLFWERGCDILAYDHQRIDELMERQRGRKDDHRQNSWNRQRNHGSPDRSQTAIAVDHRLFFDIPGDRFEEPHHQPDAERNREGRVDQHHRPFRVLQSKLGNHTCHRNEEQGRPLPKSAREGGR